ncbi:MAG: 6-bladed beta-propeller [Acidobacteriota bacterium]
MRRLSFVIWSLIVLASGNCGRGGPTPAGALSVAKTLDDVFGSKSEVQLELTDDGALAEITDLAVDIRGNFIVADGVRLNRVWLFSPEGKLLGILGASGQGPGEYSSPLSVAVDGEGQILVNDYFRMKIIVYDREYRYRREIGPVRGHYLHVEHGGRIYLYDGMVPPRAQGLFDTVKALDRAGELLFSFAPIPEAALESRFSRLADGMDIGRSGRIYEMNHLVYRIREFTPEGKLIKSFGNPEARQTAAAGEAPLDLNGPFCLASGLVIVQRENVLDIFDNDGTLAASGIPCDRRILLARGNAIYLEAWDEADEQGKGSNPRIVRYELRP